MGICVYILYNIALCIIPMADCRKIPDHNNPENQNVYEYRGHQCLLCHYLVIYPNYHDMLTIEARQKKRMIQILMDDTKVNNTAISYQPMIPGR